MNPDKSHGCKWDLKAASAEVLEAIDKTVLFPKALLSSSLSLSLSLSCSPSAFGTALLRRETRISDASDRAQGGKAVCEPIGIVLSSYRDAGFTDLTRSAAVPTMSRLSRPGRRIAESSGHTSILIRAMTRPHRDEPYWECLHRSAVLLIPKPARCCRRGQQYGTPPSDAGKRGKLSAYMGKTSVRRDEDEEAEKHCFPVSPFTYLLRDASFDSFLRLSFSLSRATTTRRIFSNGSSRRYLLEREGQVLRNSHRVLF